MNGKGKTLPYGSKQPHCVTRSVIARQAPLSVEFSRQEYRSGKPFPSPGDTSQHRD